MKRKCYISGPITGLEPAVFRANFLEASQEVEKMNYQAVNPCELDHSAHDQSWEGFMKVDLIALMECECIYLMRGWGNSRGARLEYHLAQELGLDVMAEVWDELDLIDNEADAIGCENEQCLEN